MQQLAKVVPVQCAARSHRQLGRTCLELSHAAPDHFKAIHAVNLPVEIAPRPKVG
jgi:hypothetical protein